MEFHRNQTKKSRKMKVSIRFRFDKWFNATNQKPENHQNSLFRTSCVELLSTASNQRYVLIDFYENIFVIS